MNSSKALLFQAEIQNLNDYTELIAVLKDNINNQPSCVLLNGPMGAGKTTFIQKFCESYGLKNTSSPTFVIHQSYQSQKIKIDHFDLYRLTTVEEIETSGLWEISADLSNALLFIEWFERISPLDLPLDRSIYELEIEKITELKRQVRLSRFLR